jgi:photosystem II stability/assembly factor-like uncharacterized protein
MATSDIRFLVEEEYGRRDVGMRSILFIYSDRKAVFHYHAPRRPGMRVLLCVVLTAFAAALCPAQEALRREHTVPRHPLEFESIDGPRGEVVLSIVCTKQGVLLAGTSLHGVMRSTDGGDSWMQTSLRNEAVWPMYVTPGGHIYAFIVRGQMIGHHVMVSTDTGESWTMLADSSRKYLGLAVVRVTDNAMYSEGGGGLHRSTDDGGSWETLQTTPPMDRCDADYELVVLNNSVLFAKCSRGLFRSGDGGRSWEKLPLRHSLFSVLIPEPAGGVLALGTDTVGTRRDEVLRISADGVNVEVFPVSSWKGGERRFALLSDGTMLMGSASRADGIIRSTDSARTWMPASVLSGAVHDFCQAPDGTVFAAMHGTIYRSFDEGMNWEECSNGLAKRSIFHLFSDQDGGLYSGTQDGGLYFSPDDGRGWTASTTGLCTVHLGLSVRPGNLVLGTYPAWSFTVYTIKGQYGFDITSPGLELRYTRDSTMTWHSPKYDSFYPDNLRRLMKGEGLRVYGCARGLMISDDGGETWRQDRPLEYPRDVYPNAMGVFILSDDSLSFRRSDSDTWKLLRHGTGISAVGGSGEYVFVYERDAIARSRDGGVSWETVPLHPEYPLYNPAFVSASPWATLLIGESYSIYLTSNQGRSWERIVPADNHRLRITSAIVDSDNRLILGSSEGLYRSTHPLPGSYVPHRFSLGVPWPNPAISTVTIPYALEEDGYVRLTLTDVAGREILVIFEGHRNAGKYFRVLSSYFSVFPVAGLYFCNLSVNGRVQTQPIVFP